MQAKLLIILLVIASVSSRNSRTLTAEEEKLFIEYLVRFLSFKTSEFHLKVFTFSKNLISNWTVTIR